MDNTTDGQVLQLGASLPFFIHIHGKAIRLTALATSVTAASAYLASHPDEAVIDDAAPFILLARHDDLGSLLSSVSFTNEVMEFARLIEDATPPEIQKAAEELTDAGYDMARRGTFRRIARELRGVLLAALK